MLKFPYLPEQETTFYEDLQKLEGLDLRDNRGKRHDLAFILLGVFISLLRGRDGNLSSIHRSMVNLHEDLCLLLNVSIPKAISRAQLPRILAKVNLSKLEDLVFTHFKITLDAEEKQWFAGDGKELRGSINKGDKRGEVLVQLVRHEDGGVLGQTYYNRKKESEKLALRDLLESQSAQTQKISADALHLNPKTTALIEQAGGIFLIGLKEDQKELFEDMSWYAKRFRPLNTYTTLDKGHGRIEQRIYACFDVSEEYFDPRWEKTKFRSLFQVERKRTNLKSKEESQETAYYMSNAGGFDPENQAAAMEYFNAIRGHWSVEVNNHIRDVSLKEDHFRTQKKTY